jgi:hypothetical protein
MRGWLGVMDGPQVVGHDAPWRLGGIIIQPAHIVLGLRPWEDAFEGVITPPDAAPIPWVCFDLEKIIRMMLHQSGLALTLLAGVTIEAGPVNPRAIAANAITHAQLHHWRDVTAPGVADPPADPVRWLGLVRQLLTGVLLAEHAHFMAWLPAQRPHAPAPLGALIGELLDGAPLTEQARQDSAPALSALWHRMDPARPSALPERPSGYEALNALLVQARLDAATHR